MDIEELRKEENWLKAKKRREEFHKMVISAQEENEEKKNIKEAINMEDPRAEEAWFEANRNTWSKPKQDDCPYSDEVRKMIQSQIQAYEDQITKAHMDLYARMNDGMCISYTPPSYNQSGIFNTSCCGYEPLKHQKREDDKKLEDSLDDLNETIKTFIKKGFSREEAILIISSSMRSKKKNRGR